MSHTNIFEFELLVYKMELVTSLAEKWNSDKNQGTVSFGFPEYPYPINIYKRRFLSNARNLDKIDEEKVFDETYAEDYVSSFIYRNQSIGSQNSEMQRLLQMPVTVEVSKRDEQLCKTQFNIVNAENQNQRIERGKPFLVKRKCELYNKDKEVVGNVDIWLRIINWGEPIVAQLNF